MKLIPLTQGQCAMVDDEDFEYLNQWKWYTRRDQTRFYVTRMATIGVNERKNIHMHRVIMKLNDATLFVDHIDHNPLNNQKNNLRICTHKQNSCNMSKRKNTSSKYLGVQRAHFKRGKYIHSYWQAIIRINGENKRLGLFKEELDAALAYNKAAKERDNEFANLNII